MIDECLDNMDAIKNVIVFEHKQTKMNINRVNRSSPAILQKEDGIYKSI